MVSKEAKQDLLVTLIIIAIIGSIAGAILYTQSLESQVPNPPVVEPNPDENQTNPDNNNNQTNPDPNENQTNPDNVTNPDVDYFEQVCNIKPMAEVCIKPNNSTNSTN